MTVRAQISGWVSCEELGDVLLKAGEEYADDHPVVGARPDLFSEPDKPRAAARKAAADKSE